MLNCGNVIVTDRAFRGAVRAALCLLAFSLVGCESLKKITDGPESNPGPEPLASEYTLTGKTTIDYEVIEPVRCKDSDVTVKIRKPGESEFRELNQYEFYADPKGANGGGVWLRGENKIIGGLVYPQHKPVAPAGSEYIIRSVLRKV